MNDAFKKKFSSIFKDLWKGTNIGVFSACDYSELPTGFPGGPGTQPARLITTCPCSRNAEGN